jgi:hypothetical protein
MAWRSLTTPVDEPELGAGRPRAISCPVIAISNNDKEALNRVEARVMGGVSLTGSQADAC